MKNWQEIGFLVEKTHDGSPTLRLLSSEQSERQGGESMHHSGGAWAETDLIYGRAVRHLFSFKSQECFRFLVVGLGLGYIELLIAREAIRHQISAERIQIVSYESVTELRHNLLSWLISAELVDCSVGQTYDEILKFTGAEAKEYLRKIHQNGLWQLRGSLDVSHLPQEQFHAILYDAFSSKTTPHLWEESFLNEFLKKAAATDSIFATYASKGTLKRALRMNHYAFSEELGFHGKRNSTFACRGIYSIPQS